MWVDGNPMDSRYSRSRPFGKWDENDQRSLKGGIERKKKKKLKCCGLAKDDGYCKRGRLK